VTTNKYLGIKIENKLKFNDCAFAKIKELQEFAVNLTEPS
jgi:hypothetical protein